MFRTTRLRRTLRLLGATLALALAFMGLTVVTTSNEADAAAVPAFDCLEPRFFVQTGSSVNTQLNTGTYLANGDSSWTALGPLQTTDNYNALAFNPVDEYLYGVRLSDHVVVRVDRTGTVTSMAGTIAALPVPTSLLWDSGEFDSAGNYYVASGNAGTTKITKIEVSGTGAVSTITLAPSARFADFSFKDGYLWAHNYGQSNTFYRINVDSALGAVGAVTSYSSVGVLPISSYGSAFTMTNGNLAFVATDNFMYQVSVDTSGPTPGFSLVSKVAAPGNAYSDATNCSTAPDASLTVAKTGPATVIAGEAIAWDIVVSNSGPGISSGFVVKDAFPAGLSDVEAVSNDSTCVVNATDIVCNGGRMIAGGTVSIAVTANAPSTIGSIVNSVRVLGNEDPNPSTLATEAATIVTLGTNAGGIDTAELVLIAAEAGASVTQGANGAVVNNAGTLVYTPEPHFSGIDSFTYTVGGTIVTVTVTVVPLAVDDAVTAAINTDATGDVSENDHASNAQFTILTAPSQGDVVLATDGTFTYTPDTDYTGSDTFTYMVTGDGGSDTASVAITVAAAPVAAADAVFTPANTAKVIDVIGNDSGAGISVAFLTDGAHGEAVLNADGTFTYTPDTGFSGSDSFTYALTGDGGTATATVSVTVTPVATDDVATTTANAAVSGNVATNDVGSNTSVALASAPDDGTLTLNSGGTFTYTPDTRFSGLDEFTYTLTAAGGTATATARISVTPVAPDDQGATVAGQPTVINVLGNDSGTALAVTSFTAPSHGTVTMVAGGLSYTPASGFSGIDTFRYTTTDASGGTFTAVVTVRTNPTSANDAATTSAGLPFTMTLTSNDVGTSLKVTSVATPANGTIRVNPDGTVTYSPDAGFSGVDTISYTATDASALTTTATLKVTVAPVATPDTDVAVRGGALTVPLLGNDLGTGLTVTSITQPAHGTLVLNPDGTATYTPNRGYSGKDTFTYTVTDASGQSITSSVTIDVELPTLADLPRTGADPSALAALAVLLLVIGAALRLIAPRRRGLHCA